MQHQDSQPQQRSRFIGSSESGVLLGVDTRKTPLQLWGEKTGRIAPPDLDDNARVVVGKHIEAAYRGIFHDLFGMELRKARKHRVHRHYPMIGASLDYLYRTEDAGDVPAEGKNVDFLVFRDQYEEHPDGTIEPPLAIDVQIQHQLAVTGKPYAALLLLVGGNTPKVCIRPRHEPTIQLIERECQRFWKEYVEPDVEPPANYARDLSNLQLLRTDARETADLRESDAPEAARLEELLMDYAAGKETERNGKARADQAKAQMLDLIGSAEKVLLPNGTISAKVKPAQPEQQVTRTLKAQPERRDIRPTPKASDNARKEAA